MTLEELTQRVTALERQVEGLRTEPSGGKRAKDWRRTVGMFAGDDLMRQVFAEAMLFREKDREKARSRTPPKRRTVAR